VSDDEAVEDSSSDEEDESEEEEEAVVQPNVRQRKPSTMNGRTKKGKYITDFVTINRRTMIHFLRYTVK